MYRLYGWWGSLAAYRVRVALNIKGVPYDEEPVDLAAGSQLEQQSFLSIRRAPCRS